MRVGGNLRCLRKKAFCLSVLDVPHALRAIRKRLSNCCLVSGPSIAQVARNICSAYVRAARLQNKIAPDKVLNRYEKWFEKHEKGSEKRSETCPKSVSPSPAA